MYTISAQSFVSRFPLTVIKAQDAKGAARAIAGYLAQAQALGWEVGSAQALVEDWRNEYELTKDGQKTVFRFDMRPTLMLSSRLELVALSLVAGKPKLEEVIRNLESGSTVDDALIRAGFKVSDTSNPPPNPKLISPTMSDIAFNVDQNATCLNRDTVEALMQSQAELVRRGSTFAMRKFDLLFLLIQARAQEWKGANDLFQATQNGFGLSAVLLDGQHIDDADAFTLSATLTQMNEMVEDRTEPMLIIAQSFAQFAALGGFTIQYEPLAVAKAKKKGFWSWR